MSFCRKFWEDSVFQQIFHLQYCEILGYVFFFVVHHKSSTNNSKNNLFIVIGRGRRRKADSFLLDAGVPNHHRITVMNHKTVLGISYLMETVLSITATRFRYTIYGDMEKLADILHRSNLGLSIVKPKFSGKTQKLVTAWLENFNLVARVNEWTDAKKAKKIPICLEYFAQKVSPHQTEWTNWSCVGKRLLFYWIWSTAQILAKRFWG